MAEDPEVAAMSKVASAVSELDDDSRQRVIEWAARKYNATVRPFPKAASVAATKLPRPLATQLDSEDFVDLFDSANPTVDADRALVGAYWFQRVQAQPSFDSQQVNNVLKDVGQGISNITQALTTLQNRKPALVRQMAKSGKSQQARKTYKLTGAGVAAVEQMLVALTEED